MNDDEYAFKCPVCGSSFFTTYGTGPRGMNGPRETWVRKCKGHLESPDPRRYKCGYTGCSFTWPIADDAKYGLKVER